MKVHKLEIRKSLVGKFRWRKRSRNGEIIDAATQGFTRYRNCRMSIELDGTDAAIAVPAVWKRGASTYVAVRGKAGTFVP
jgi:uncharacterized protein YegP (UPF0339 family)